MYNCVTDFKLGDLLKNIKIGNGFTDFLKFKASEFGNLEV